MQLRLLEIAGEFAVVRLPAGADIPAWSKSSRFCSITRTEDELSVVCEAHLVPPGAGKIEGRFGAIKVDGPLDFSLTGIMAAIATPLAAAKISIFAISTFDTDYILVKTETMNAAKKTLTAAGFTFNPGPSK